MKKIAILVSLIASSGLALAGDPVKAGAPAPKDAKATPAAPAMEMPKPAPEIAEMAKQMTGTWKCTGTAVGMDGKTEAKFTGTMTAKSDLDGFWIHDSFTGNMGEGKAAMKFKMESFRTYGTSDKKWHAVSVMNDGGMMTGTGDMTGGKGEMAYDSWSNMGSGMFKDHIDATDMKKGVHMNGEMSMDKGKSWNKVYDMTCKK